MDKATFERLIEVPAEISSEEAGLLEELAESFPYCQSAHLLLAKESQQKKSMHYPKRLRKASAYALDRKVLHKVLHPFSPKSPSSQISVNPKLQKEPASTPYTFSQPVITPQNIVVLQELEENIRLLKQNRDSNSHLLFTPSEQKEEDIFAKEIKQPIEKVEKAEVPVDAGSLSLEETKLGYELAPESKGQVEMLLSYLNRNNISIANESPTNYSIDQGTIIDQFIANEPKIGRQISNFSEEIVNPDLSKKSTELKIELVTENFAQILTKQNKIEKAKEVYRKLILKYPDKSAYFAAKLYDLETR